MEEKMITNDTFVLAKEKGFSNDSVPTQCGLVKWLREVHDIQVYVNSVNDYSVWQYFAGCKIGYNDIPFGCKEKEDYEKVLEHGLIETIKLL